MTMEQLKQFALDVHNFAFATKYDDLDIVSSMDLDCVVEELNKDKDKMYKEMDELKAENTELMKEQYKLLDEKESLSTTFWTKNEELKEDIERLKGKATAWKIINAGTDWENIAQICDEEMARELVKTGEVNWMDFDFLIWPENEEE